MNPHHFINLPSPKKILNSLRAVGILSNHDIINIELFEHSSYNPVFCISVSGDNNKTSKFVMRGEAQIAGTLGVVPELALQNEVFVMKLLAENGIRVPELISEGKIFSISSMQDGKMRNFNYFLMSYIPGIAIDNAMKGANQSTQQELLDQIAVIYASIHKIKGAYFGNIQSQSSNSYPDFKGAVVNQKKRYEQLIGMQEREDLSEVREAYKAYNARASTIIDDLSKKYAKLNEASLVIFDGSAGNMLVDKTRIALIDFDLSHYGCSLVDFCATLYCLEKYFFGENLNDQNWKNYLSKYISYGGWLPSSKDFEQLFPHIFIDFLMSSAIDGISHRLERKKNAGKKTFKELIKLINKQDLNTKDIIASIRKIKVH